MMIKPIINAAMERPIVAADTVPLERYSRTIPSDAPTRSAQNIMKNLPFVMSFGCGRFGCDESFIALGLTSRISDPAPGTPDMQLRVRGYRGVRRIAGPHRSRQ